MELPDLLGLPQTQDQRGMADTPRSVSRSRKRKGARKSVQLGMLLILQEEGHLSQGQIRFLVKLQGRMKFEELLRAQELYLRIRRSPRAFARSVKERQEILRSTPSLSSKSFRFERRRIGVGYRDKGALRPPHRNWVVEERSWWSEDVPGLSSQSFNGGEPRWISAEELFGSWRYGPEFEVTGRYLQAKAGNFDPLSLLWESTEK